MIRQGRRVDEADLTNKAIEANKADADKAEDVNEAIVVVKAKVEEAIVADEANVANKTNEANKPIRLTWPRTRLLCLLSCRCCTHSPSQNVPQSLWK